MEAFRLSKKLNAVSNEPPLFIYASTSIKIYLSLGFFYPIILYLNYNISHTLIVNLHFKQDKLYKVETRFSSYSQNELLKLLLI